MNTALLLQVLFAGLSIGAVYTLVALGFGVVWSGTGAINFVQGEYVMLGGVVAALTRELTGLSLVWCVLIALAVSGLAGLLTEFGILGWGRLRSGEAITIATIAVAVIVKGVVMLTTDRRTYGLPTFLGDAPIRVGGAGASTQMLWNLGTALVAVVALTVFFRTTRRGTMLRAAADDREVAASFGVSFRSTARWTFVLAALLGGLAGAGLAPLTVMSFDSGTLLGLKGFAAAMLGGLGNPYGALAGGLALGVAEAAVAGYGAPAYADAVAFVVLLVVLFARPTGLFSAAKVARV